MPPPTRNGDLIERLNTREADFDRCASQVQTVIAWTAAAKT